MAGLIHVVVDTLLFAVFLTFVVFAIFVKFKL